MKGDFTRFTFDPSSHYTSVRMQQGRVQLDADWNEQVDIQFYQQQAATAAFIGQSGAPKLGGGLAIGVAAGTTPDLTISAGRFYVDGLLCEQPDGQTYLTQSYYPQAPALTTPGVYLAYLDVFTRQITTLEDPRLREVALSGPDTTTRTQTVWQVKLQPMANLIADAASLDFSTIVAKPDLLLAARAYSDPALLSGSLLPAGTGYQRLDNLLYRVEIHQGGTIGTDAVTYKWSRNNGSIVAAWIDLTGNAVTIGYPGRDTDLGFSIGDFVELTDDNYELLGQPGLFVQVTNVEGNVLTIEPPAGAVIVSPTQRVNPKVRLWDMGGAAQPLTTGGWLSLEAGLQVAFSGTRCQAGDYWMIPARSAIRNVLWPQQSGQPAALPPRGVPHAYAPLAQLTFDGTKITIPSAAATPGDLRLIFPSLADLRKVDPDTFEAFMQGHTHTGGADGTKIPRAGIADSAVDGTKVDPTSALTVQSLASSSLSVSGASTLSGALSVSGATSLGTLSVSNDSTVNGTLSVGGTDIYLSNSTALGTRTGSRSALSHGGGSGADQLIINSGGAYTGGISLNGQILQNAPSWANGNNLYLGNSGDTSSGLGYYSTTKLWSGQTITGPALFGSSGGVLGINHNPQSCIDGSLVLSGGYASVPLHTANFSGGITVEAWVYYTSVSPAPANSRIVDFSNGTSNNIILGNSGTSSDLTFIVYSGATKAFQATVSGALTGSTWIHVAATIDASNNLQMYVNGSAQSFTLNSGSVILPSIDSRLNSYAGKSSFGDAMFQGKIANLGVWGRALTALELADRVSNQRQVATTSLLGFWPFNEGTGTVISTASAADKSVRKQTATIHPAATLESYQSTALSWDSSNNVKVTGNTTIGTTTASSSLTVNGATTITGTLNPSSALSIGGASAPVLIGGDATVSGTLNPSSALSIGGASAPVAVNGNLTVSGAQFLMDNTTNRGGRTGTGTYRRALVHDTSDTLTINYAGDYSSGVQVAGQLSMNGRTFLNDNGVYLRNASSGDYNHGLSYFGTIRPFAGASIEGPGLFGNSGGVLGTTTSAATGVHGAVVFPTTSSSFVTLPSLASSIDFSQGFAVEAWVYFSSLSNSNARIIDLGAGSANNNIIFAQSGTTTKLQFQIYAGTSSAFTVTTANSCLSANTWMHLAATVDNIGNVAIYVNGSAQSLATTVGTLTVPLNVARGSSYLGRSNTSTDGYFQGKMAQLRIWSRALASYEVSDHYTNTRPVNTTSGLVVYLPLDDGSGLTARDRSKGGTAYPGTYPGTLWLSAYFETYQTAALNWDSSGGVQVNSQLVQNGPSWTATNDIHFYKTGDTNIGIGWYGTASSSSQTKPWNGSTAIGGPVVYGASGGALGTANLPAVTVEGSLVLPGGLSSGTASYVTVPTRTDDFSGGFTLEVWVYWNYSSTPPTNAHIIDFGGGGVDNIILGNSGSSTDLYFDVYNSNTHIFRAVASGAIASQTWMHLAVTVDANNNCTIYKNGVALSSSISFGAVALPRTVSRTGNYIGRSNWGADALFPGKIAKVRLWGRALSAAELGYRVSNTRQVSNTSLLAYWPLNEGTGAIAAAATATAYDRSGYGQNATVSGAATLESYQSTALTWDSSNNVSVTGKLSSGNYRYSTGPKTGVASVSVTSTSTWADLDPTNLSVSFSTSGTSYVLITCFLPEVQIYNSAAIAGVVYGTLRLLLDNATVASSLIYLAGTGYNEPVTLTYCGLLTGTSHTVKVQAQVSTINSGATGFLSTGAWGGYRHLSIIEL